MNEHQVSFSRKELLQFKGRITAPFFRAENLPKDYLEQLNNRISDIITNKARGENANENLK